LNSLIFFFFVKKLLFYNCLRLVNEYNKKSSSVHHQNLIQNLNLLNFQPSYYRSCWWLWTTTVKWTVIRQNCVVICDHLGSAVFPTLRCPTLRCVACVSMCTRPYGSVHQKSWSKYFNFSSPYCCNVKTILKFMIEFRQFSTWLFI